MHGKVSSAGNSLFKAESWSLSKRPAGRLRSALQLFVVPPLGGIVLLSRRFRRLVPPKGGTTNGARRFDLFFAVLCPSCREVPLRFPKLIACVFVQVFFLADCWGQTTPTQPPIRRNPGGLGMFGTVVPGGQYPASEYYAGLEFYRAGELDRAIERFDSALGGSRLDANGRWIDGIPSLAMLGECYWHLGDLQQAKLHFDKVFEILIKKRGWLARTEWSSIPTQAVRQKPTWLWNEAKRVPLLEVSDRVPFRAGNQITEASIARGGALEEPSIRQIDIIEVMRGVCIASFRRRLILGELTLSNRMSEGVLESTKYPRNMNVPVGRISDWRDADRWTLHQRGSKASH